MIKLNLGCGKRKLPGWVNLDCSPEVQPDILRRLEDGIPYPDNYIDQINARAILEHVDRDKLIFVMSEIHRVLKPGGLVYVMVPHWNQKWMWSDPTHQTPWDRTMMEWFIGKNKPSDIGIGFHFSELFYQEILHRDAISLAMDFGVTLDKAKKALANIIDAHVWVLAKPGANPHSAKDFLKEIADLKVYPNGYSFDDIKINTGMIKESKVKDLLESIEIKQPITPRRQINRLFWIINVAWKGGTGLWALEAIRDMPLWSHYVCYMNGEADPEMEQLFLEAGCDFSKIPAAGITQELINNIQPAAIIMSNTDPNRIEGSYPWTWFAHSAPVIYVHHSAVRPWFPGAAVDVFVSEYLRGQYSNLLKNMQQHMVVPTGIDINKFLISPVQDKRQRITVGMMSSASYKVDFERLVRVVRECNVRGDFMVTEPGKKIELGSDLDITWREIGSMPPEEFLKGLDIYIHAENIPETWGRTNAEAMAAGLPVVAENRGGIPEVVQDSEWLYNSDEELFDAILRLKEDDDLRLKVGLKNKNRAIQSFGDNLFKKIVEPIIIEKVLKS